MDFISPELKIKLIIFISTKDYMIGDIKELFRDYIENEDVIEFIKNNIKDWNNFEQDHSELLDAIKCIYSF